MLGFRSVLRAVVAGAPLTTALTAIPGTAGAAPLSACGRPAGAPTIIFNPCVSLDLTGIEDCRSGTCYSYCWTRWVTVWCEEQFKFINVQEWLTYKSGTRPPRGCHTT